MRSELILRVGCAVALFAAVALAHSSELPRDVRGTPSPEACISAVPNTSSLALSGWTSPHCWEADFNGDGQIDTALLVVNARSMQKGILIVHGSTNESFLLGAGNDFGNGGEDFSWMDQWFVKPVGPVNLGAELREQPTLTGDALMVVKTDAASGLIYWTEVGYAWYQQGD